MLKIYTYKQEEADLARLNSIQKWSLMVTIAIGLTYILFSCSLCHAAKKSPADARIEEYPLDKWVNAIYITEGGAKTSHPYGILATYKHTTARDACKNTIKHKYQQWDKLGRKGPFLAFLGAKYCPVGALNDPMGLNRNWITNVKYYLERG